MDMNTIALIKGLAGNGGGGSSLPTNPAQDGTYALQNTVSSGTSTLSWASGGSSGGVLVVNDVDGTLDKTAAEIMAAFEAGGVVVKNSANKWVATIVSYIQSPLGSYSFSTGGNDYQYEASSASDYPVFD